MSSAAPQRGLVGMKLAAGQVVTTTTGRPTSPFPKIEFGTNRKAANTIKRSQEWLSRTPLPRHRRDMTASIAGRSRPLETLRVQRISTARNSTSSTRRSCVQRNHGF